MTFSYNTWDAASSIGFFLPSPGRKYKQQKREKEEIYKIREKKKRRESIHIGYEDKKKRKPYEKRAILTQPQRNRDRERRPSWTLSDSEWQVSRSKEGERAAGNMWVFTHGNTCTLCSEHLPGYTNTFIFTCQPVPRHHSTSQRHKKALMG